MSYRSRYLPIDYEGISVQKRDDGFYNLKFGLEAPSYLFVFSRRALVAMRDAINAILGEDE